MKYPNYQAFWKFYVQAHQNDRNRYLHCVGTSLGVIGALAACYLGLIWLFVAGVVIGYGFSWIGHFFAQANRPATFQHPLWSLRGDFKMLALTLTGRWSHELNRLKQIL